MENQVLTVEQAIDSPDFLLIFRERLAAYFKVRHDIVLSRHVKARRNALDRLFDRGLFIDDDALRAEIKKVLEGTSKLSKHERDILKHQTMFTFATMIRLNKTGVKAEDYVCDDIIA